MDGSTEVITQLSFFIVFALLGTVLSIRMRQPYVVGLLLLGAIAGPNVLGLVNEKELISAFSNIGAILLLFTVGLEFSISRILKSGLRAVFITLFKMSILFAFGYEIALYAGLDFTAALFLGAMMSITSTALLYKITTDKGMAKNRMMPLLFSMLIVEDIVAVAALTFFSSLSSSAGSPTTEDKFFSVLISLGFLGAFYVLVRKGAARAILRLTQSFNMEVMIFVSFSLCLVMSMVAQFFGLSPAIGAFLAGSIISTLPNSRAIERSIRPLLLTFASLFFLSLGMQIDPSAVAQNWGLALAFFAAFVLVCFVSVLWLLYSTGSSSKNSLFGASAMVVLGEFSLIIASVAPDSLSQLLIAIGSFGVIASAIVSSFLLDRQPALLSFGLNRMPRPFKDASIPLSRYISGLLRDFSPSGSFWKVSTVCWECVRSKIGMMGIIAILIIAARVAIGIIWQSYPSEASQLRAIALLVGIAPLLYYLIGIIRDLHPVLDALSHTVARHKKSAKTENKILRDLAAIAVLLLLAITINEFVSGLKLPSLFNWADDAAFLLALVFIWDLLHNAMELGRKKNALAR